MFSFPFAVAALAFTPVAVFLFQLVRHSIDSPSLSPAPASKWAPRTPMRAVVKTLPVPVYGPCEIVWTFPSSPAAPANARHGGDLLNAGSYDAVARSLSRMNDDRSTCAVERPLYVEQAVTYGEASVTVLGPTVPVRRRCSICLN